MTDQPNNPADRAHRFIGKVTPKGLVIKALALNGEPLAVYFIAVRQQAFVGALKRIPGFEPVTGRAGDGDVLRPALVQRPDRWRTQAVGLAAAR
jgi:hypothetical protein